MRQLRNVALGADLDAELFAHMTSAAGRSALASALLRSCFSEAGQRSLGEQTSVHGEAFRYSRVLEEAAHSLAAGESELLPLLDRGPYLEPVAGCIAATE